VQTWTSFDMPATLSLGSNSSQFTYGSDHQRAKQIRSDGTTIWYGDGIEVETTASQTKVKTYWPMSLGLEIDVGSTNQQLWSHKDRLGSVVAISDSNGNLLVQSAFDVWGSRRNLNGTAATSPIVESLDNKGYTGQEELDQIALVHLNGRVYDSMVGRFLSGDSYVVDPTEGQDYNRYSYVSNNPANSTDPSGFAERRSCPPGWQATRGGGCRGDDSWANPGTNFAVAGSSCFVCMDILKKGNNNYELEWVREAVITITNEENGNASTHVEPGFWIVTKRGVDTGVDQGNPKFAAAPDEQESRASIWAHRTLTAASFSPSVIGAGFSYIDAGVYAFQGKWADAGISAAAATVGIFSDAGLAKLAGKGVKEVVALTKEGEVAAKALPSPRRWLLDNAVDPKLRNRIEALYRETARVGNGGTADALRYERATGRLLSPSGHAQKAIEMRNGLLDDLKSGRLNDADTRIARQLLKDLQDALTRP